MLHLTTIAAFDRLPEGGKAGLRSSSAVTSSSPSRGLIAFSGPALHPEDAMDT